MVQTNCFQSQLNLKVIKIEHKNKIKGEIMKKTFVTLFCCVLLLQAAPVNETSARQAAINWQRYNSGKSDTEISSVFCATVAEQTAYYGINFKTGGFVLLSGNDAARPVLGYSSSGTLELETSTPEKISLPSVREWLLNYRQQLADINRQKTENSSNLALWQQLLQNDFTAYSRKEVAPLVTTTWSQDYPYNMYCPPNNGALSVVGCVATAMSQILRYHQYPLHGNGSHSDTQSGYNLTVNYADQTYNWGAMSSSGLDMDLFQQQEIAKICYQTGVAVDMEYSANGSGAQSSAIPEALISHFNYSPQAVFVERTGFTDPAWSALLHSELEAGRPVLYSGFGNFGGHAFVCDGYQNNDYYHFNWGWNGAYDGFFTINSLTPSPCAFNEDNSVVYKIQPADSNLPPVPAGLSLNMSGQQVQLSWSGSGSHFNIYRNNTLIATVQDQSYGETISSNEPFYTYFVTTLQNQQESRPSNTVFVDQAPPTLLKIRGNYGAVGQNMHLVIKADDLNTISSSTAIYTVNGAVNEQTMTPVSANKHAQSFECYLPIQTSCMDGSVKFKVKDVLNQETITSSYPLKWLYKSDLVENFESGSFTSPDWLFSGNANWTVVNDNNLWSVRSGNISQGQNSVLEIKKTFISDGRVKFKKKTACEPFTDHLYFDIDGQNIGDWNGVNDWSTHTYSIPIGEHTLRWSYSKYSFNGAGNNCAWLDDIELINIGSTTNDITTPLAVKSDLRLTGYPNPFNNSTILSYQLPADRQVILSIYNSRGEMVRKLVDAKQSAGTHAISFSGNDLNSGLYFCRLNAGGIVTNSKLVLLK